MFSPSVTKAQIRRWFGFGSFSFGGRFRFNQISPQCQVEILDFSFSVWLIHGEGNHEE